MKIFKLISRDIFFKNNFYDIFFRLFFFLELKYLFKNSKIVIFEKIVKSPEINFKNFFLSHTTPFPLQTTTNYQFSCRNRYVLKQLYRVIHERCNPTFNNLYKITDALLVHETATKCFLNSTTHHM